MPFNIDDNLFYATDIYSTATLYVPAGTLELYKAAKGWKNFYNIVELEETGIDTQESGNPSVEASYDLRGHRLDTPQRGLNIIRMSDETVRKVMVK